MFIMDEIRENTAGAIMTPEFVRLRAGTRTGEAILAVRASGLDSDALYTLFITDQDGRLLGSRTTGYDRDAALGALEDMAGLSGETALLMDAERVGGGRAEIVFVPDEGIEAAEEEYNHVLYMQPGCVMKDAWAQESGVLLLLEREDGRQSRI